MDGPVLLHVLTDKGHGFEPADEGPGQVPRPRPVPDGRGRDHPAQDRGEQGVHRRRQRRPLRGDAARPEGRRPHGRDVRGEQAPEDPRHLPRPVLRRRDLREPRRRLRRRAWPRPARGRSSTSTARSSSARSTRSSRKSRSRTCRSSSRSTAPAWSGPTGRRTTARTTWPTCGSSRTWSSWPPATRRTSPRCSTSPSATTRRSSIRYPKANLETIEREVQPIELGQAEILEWETDGMFLACGTLVGTCLRAAERLREQYGLRVGVDQRPVRQAARQADGRSRRSRSAASC